MTSNGTNGHMSRFYAWFMGAIVAPAIIAGTASLTHMVIADNGRITALERDTEHRLQQIETKLDRLLGAR